MFADLYRLMPPEGAKILVVLFLAFLTGLEREERHAGQFLFGGVRTYPLIGLIAYGNRYYFGKLGKDNKWQARKRGEDGGARKTSKRGETVSSQLLHQFLQETLGYPVNSDDKADAFSLP